MDEAFIRQRITQLRIQKNISEYKLSIELGHSKGYIQSITSGRALPSMSEFLLLCEYFDITPLDFFNVENTNPSNTNHLINIFNRLDKEDADLLTNIANRLNTTK